METSWALPDGLW